LPHPPEVCHESGFKGSQALPECVLLCLFASARSESGNPSSLRVQATEAPAHGFSGGPWQKPWGHLLTRFDSYSTIAVGYCETLLISANEKNQSRPLAVRSMSRATAVCESGERPRWRLAASEDWRRSRTSIKQPSQVLKALRAAFYHNTRV